MRARKLFQSEQFEPEVHFNVADPPRSFPFTPLPGCCGHLVECVNGYRAYDQDSKCIGLFRTPQIALAAVLERAATGIPDSSE
jgi:hypothetical protein